MMRLFLILSSRHREASVRALRRLEWRIVNAFEDLEGLPYSPGAEPDRPPPPSEQLGWLIWYIDSARRYLDRMIKAAPDLDVAGTLIEVDQELDRAYGRIVAALEKTRKG